MAWKFDGLNQVAEHSETKTKFKVRQKGGETEGASIELIPLGGNGLHWSDEALKQQKQLLSEAIKQADVLDDRRRRLQRMIREKLGGDNFRAASIISRESGKAVSARSVQAWLIEPGRRSSRNCPQWVVDLLEAYQPAAPRAERAHNSASSGFSAFSQNSVDIADRRIEAEELRLKRWETTPVSALPKKLSDMEGRLYDYVTHLEKKLAVVTNALRNSESFADYKSAVHDGLDQVSSTAYAVHQAKLAIENQREEFSNPDGLPHNSGE